MRHAGSIAWRDTEGEVSIHFCRSDRELGDSLHSRRDLVEARLVRWSLEDLGDEPGAAGEPDRGHEPPSHDM